MEEITCLDCGKVLGNIGGIVAEAWVRQEIGKLPEGFVCNDCHSKVQKIAGEIYEWEFPEPSRLVNLERICMEVNNIPAIAALMYMRKLRDKAPIVYKRLKIWAKENNRMKWYNWETHDAEKG